MGLNRRDFSELNLVGWDVRAVGQVEAQRRLWHFAMGPRLGKLLLKASILVQFLLIRVQSTGRVICKGIRRLILMPYVLEEDHQIFGPNKGESSKPSSEEVY